MHRIFSKYLKILLVQISSFLKYLLIMRYFTGFFLLIALPEECHKDIPTFVY